MTANTSGIANRGVDLLRDPQLIKSAAFTAGQREALGLTGLLPAAVAKFAFCSYQSFVLSLCGSICISSEAMICASMRSRGFRNVFPAVTINRQRIRSAGPKSRGLRWA